MAKEKNTRFPVSMSWLNRAGYLTLALSMAAPSTGFAFIDRIFPDSYYLTLNPRAQPQGPVLDQDPKEYAKNVFRILVYQADRQARDPFYNEADAAKNYNLSYYSFLVLSLTVPFHESRLNHFRTATGNRCVERVNNLSSFMDEGSSYNRLRSSFKTSTLDPVVPDCFFFSKSEQVTQALISSTNDLGIMQINASSHPTALHTDIFLNLDAFVEYGLTYLLDGRGYRGFEETRERVNAARFPCLWKQGRLDYRNLVRSAWSRYNSGSDVCRFARTSSDDAAKDKGFEKALNDIVNMKTASVYTQLLEEGSLEWQALTEILYNFKNAGKIVPEKNLNLNTLLAEERASHGIEVIGNPLSAFETTHSVPVKVLNARSAPTMQSTVCGVIGKDSGVTTVRVLRKSGTVDGMDWIEYMPPMKDAFLKSRKAECRGRRSFFSVAENLKPSNDPLKKTAWVKANTAIVRKIPSIYGLPVDMVSKDRLVFTTDATPAVGTSGWVFISNGNLSGWVRGFEVEFE